VDLVRLVRQPIGAATLVISAPSFDHELKDPVNDAITIKSTHRLVIVEGIYLQLQGVDAWENLPVLMDENWWLQCDPTECRRRLIHRHIQAGICSDETAATHQVDQNDMLNAQFILDHRIAHVDRIIN
ncbi:hypothetical protein BJ085DRAFT_19370, partial [Dimargaris cristalligena]